MLTFGDLVGFCLFWSFFGLIWANLGSHLGTQYAGYRVQRGTRYAGYRVQRGTRYVGYRVRRGTRYAVPRVQGGKPRLKNNKMEIVLKNDEAKMKCVPSKKTSKEDPLASNRFLWPELSQASKTPALHRTFNLSFS